MPFPACCVPLGISLAGKPDDDRVSDFTFSLPLAKGGICIVPRCLRCFRRLPDARILHRDCSFRVGEIGDLSPFY